MKTKSIPVILALSSLAVCGLRLYQIALLTEPETGFLSRSDWSVAALWVLLPLSLALLLVAGALSFRGPEVSFAGAAGRSTGLFLLLPAVSILWESLQGLLFSQQQAPHLGGQNLSFWWNLLELLGVAAAAGCFFLCGELLSGKAPSRPLALPGLLLAAYLLLRALLTFLSAPAVITLPSMLFRVLALTGMGVFYLAAARLFSGIGGQQGRRGLLIYGSCGLLLALASAVPTVLGALCFGAQKAGISFETVTAAALAVCGIQLMERTIRPGK